MKTFHIFILLIALLFFIGLVVYTLIIDYLYTKPEVFPRDMTSCPDYWEIDESGNCIIPMHVNHNNVGKLAYSQDFSYNLYEHSSYQHSSKLGSNYLMKYDDLTLIQNGIPKSTVKVGDQKKNGIYRYDIQNSIPAGYDSRNPGVIDFKSSDWALKSTHKGLGDPYCGIGEWVKQNDIQWDSINAYYKSVCKK
uniref:Uncharacterized protein n=1 Tax=viral metagenome TaxID=1070528 RepID=A0A6C0E1X2_9ZZZZ